MLGKALSVCLCAVADESHSLLYYCLPLHINFNILLNLCVGTQVFAYVCVFVFVLVQIVPCLSS